MQNNDKKLSQLHVATTLLPNHLILQQILPRLPVKSLYRFKSVCKNWNFTISQNNFVKSHLRFSSYRPQQFFLHAKENGNSIFYLLTYDACTKFYVRDLIVPLHDFDHLNGNICIVGSCNGLVCLYYEHNQCRLFYTWNLVTRQSREIDQITEHEETEQHMFTAAYGFGYVSSIDDYKITVIFTSYSDDFTSRFYVFSLKLGKWNRLTCGLDGYRISTTGVYKGVLIDDDTLYWPLRFRNQGEESKHIAGFDLVHDRLEVNRWMSWLREGSDINVPLFCIKGCLSLCHYTDDCCFDVWMLQQRDDWSSWQKLFSVNIGYVDLIHFCKNGRLCLVHHMNQLKVIEPTPEAIELTQWHTDEHCKGQVCYKGLVWDIDDYAESFVSPFLNTQQDAKNNIFDEG